MKPITREFKRPATSRFAPTEAEKKAVACEWVDCGPVAMYAIECGSGITWNIYTDRHGYPAS